MNLEVTSEFQEVSHGLFSTYRTVIQIPAGWGTGLVWEIRRRRSLISAQGSSLREPWDPIINKRTTLKGFVLKANPFRVKANVYWLTQGSRKLEPGAEISERLRRIFKLNHPGLEEAKYWGERVLRRMENRVTVTGYPGGGEDVSL